MAEIELRNLYIYIEHIHNMSSSSSQHLNTRGIFEPSKQSQFNEFLEFTLSRKNALSYPEFQRNVGVSRIKWDKFRAQNVDVKEVEWIVE